MFILGITGGIATGKSSVCRIFERYGAVLLDADAIARSVLLPGSETALRVAEAFPECTVPGTHGVINRRVLADVIFRDEEARRRLEAITHPEIIAELSANIETYRRQPDHGLVVAEIPLLYEAELEHLVDRVVVVACEEDTQIARLRARLDISEADARAYIAAQIPLPEKKSRADFIITTDGSLADTERQIELLLLQLGFA